LLCQVGFSSRVGAVWLTRELGATFTDMNELRIWLALQDALLSDPDFWKTEGMFTLWKHTSSPVASDYPRPWSRSSHSVVVDWQATPPAADSRVRIVPGPGRNGTVCSVDLIPLGTAQFVFDPHGAAIDANVSQDGSISVAYFGKS